VPPAWCRPTSACSLTPLRVDEIVPILNVGINRSAVPIDLAARLMRQALGGTSTYTAHTKLNSFWS
jgi:hypothetical protein